MGVANYYSVEGEILGDSHAGDYMRDALGSVTGTCNPDDGAVQNTYRYKPYGERLTKTRSSPDPKFVCLRARKLLALGRHRIAALRLRPR